MGDQHGEATASSTSSVGSQSVYQHLTSTDRAAILMQLAGADNDDESDDNDGLASLQNSGFREHSAIIEGKCTVGGGNSMKKQKAKAPAVKSKVYTAKSKVKVKGKGKGKADADNKPLGHWNLVRGNDGTLRLASADDNASQDDVEVVVHMPALHKRIAMNLSLSEQPHNGIELNGDLVDTEPIVRSSGLEIEWAGGPGSPTKLKIMPTKKVPFAHGCDHDTRYLLFIDGRESRTGKREEVFWWEINFRLAIIGLACIVLFAISLGISFIPNLGSVASYVLRVTAILGIVGLYELIVGLVSLSKLHGKCSFDCLCPPLSANRIGNTVVTGAVDNGEYAPIDAV